MKKLLLFLVVVPVLSSGGWAATAPSFVWSYGALAETMRDMRDHCEPTGEKQFIKIGNWMREKNATFSPAELVEKCKEVGFQDIDRTLTTTSDKQVPTCKLPTKNCQPYKIKGKRVYKCGEGGFTANTGCDIFLATFMKNNNKRAEILQSRKPGTYVQKTEDGVYRVVDVILADGYWTRGAVKNAAIKFGVQMGGALIRYVFDADGSINETVNTDENNTKIWEVTEDGEIKDTGYHTWTNDMFLGISAAKDPAGNVTGAFVNSFIFTNIDVTKDVYDNLMAIGTSVGDIPDYVYESTKLFSKGNSLYDPKIYFPKKYPELSESQMYDVEYESYTRSQRETEVHSNGVMFEGKIVMLDWLGNLMVGFNNSKITQRPGPFINGVSESTKTVIENVGDGVTHLAQVTVDAKNTGVKAIGQLSNLHIWEARKTLDSFEVRPEPFKAQHAWAEGKQFFEKNLTVLYDLENVYVDTAAEADRLAVELIIQKYGFLGFDAASLNCTANCSRPNSVFCSYDEDEETHRFLIKFGGVCREKPEYKPTKIPESTQNLSRHRNF